MYKIDDIKAGYLLEMDNGEYYTVNYNNRNILGIGNKNNSLREIYCDLMNFDDNLYCDWRKIKINKIYGRTFNGYLDFASPKDRKLLWDRKEYKKEIYMKETELQKMANNINSELNNIMGQFYNLGQVSIISSILHCINNENFESKDVKKYLKLYLDKNQELKSMTYDCMKDY